MDHASGIAAGILADRLIKDPQRYHPVALFGQYALWWERRLYRDNKVAGAVFAAVCVLPPTLVAAGVAKRAPRLATAVALWAALGGTSLERTGMRMAQALESGDEDCSRGWVPWLCSRDPELLDAPAWLVPPLNPWRRIRRTPPLHRWCGLRWRARRVWWHIAASIPWMRWWGTATNGTAISAGRREARRRHGLGSGQAHRSSPYWFRRSSRSRCCGAAGVA